MEMAISPAAAGEMRPGAGFADTSSPPPAKECPQFARAFGVRSEARACRYTWQGRKRGVVLIWLRLATAGFHPRTSAFPHVAESAPAKRRAGTRICAGREEVDGWQYADLVSPHRHRAPTRIYQPIRKCRYALHKERLAGRSSRKTPLLLDSPAVSRLGGSAHGTTQSVEQIGQKLDTD